jgi:type I restriction enzyme M protein
MALDSQEARMSPRISQQQLESYLWGAATLLRGTIDAGDYKQFIFPLLFYKRICDVFDEETATALKESGGDKTFAAYRENHRFQVPPEAHWFEVRQTSNNVGQALQSAMRTIETANPEKLYGIFGDAQWTNKDRLSDAMLRDLVEHFSSLELTLANLPEDELGQGYEYLIKKFADDAGHTAAEFYTNRTVVHLMTEMLEPQPGESIYDPTCGSGGMLLSCITHLRRQRKEWRNVRLYGQERNLMTSSIARMNCFLHGIENFQIVRGDTLSEPKFVQGDRLMRFDVVLANPPYSIKQWDRDAFASDPWGRNLYGTPPQGRADYAFWQHILCSLTPKTGRCAILFPHGVLFRQEESEMRRKLIEADIIECVLGLGPNLFYNSPMEACVVICRAVKPKVRKGRILFIDAVNEVTRDRAQSFLTDDHIEHIVKAYERFKDEAGFTHVATRDEIRKQGGNLNISLYVAATEPTPVSNGTANGNAVRESLTAWHDSAAEARNALKSVLGDKLASAQLPVATKIAKALPGWLKRSEWKRFSFGAFADSVNERVEPADAMEEIYVGLDDLDAGNLHIRRWGKGSDVIGTKLHFRKGDIIFGRRRAYQRKLAIAEVDGICSAHAMVVRAKPEVVLPEFLPFLMMGDLFMNRAVEISVGSLSPTINWTTLKVQEFDLPPLDQQRRVAEILWAVDKVCTECEETLRASSEALNARLSEALSVGPNGTPKPRFPTKALSEIAFLQTGIAKGKEYPENIPTVELPYLRVANVQDGRLDLSEMKTIVIPKAEKERYLLRDRDVVICEGGDFDKVGRGTIWRGQVPVCLHQNHVFCLRADRSLLLPEFLALQLGSSWGKRYFLSCAKKTSNLASINSTQVKAFPFQLPPLQNQRALVDEINQVENAKQATAAHLDASRSMLRALAEALT